MNNRYPGYVYVGGQRWVKREEIPAPLIKEYDRTWAVAEHNPSEIDPLSMQSYGAQWLDTVDQILDRAPAFDPDAISKEQDLRKLAGQRALDAMLSPAKAWPPQSTYLAIFPVDLDAGETLYFEVNPTTPQGLTLAYSVVARRRHDRPERVRQFHYGFLAEMSDVVSVLRLIETPPMAFSSEVSNGTLLSRPKRRDRVTADAIVAELSQDASCLGQMLDRDRGFLLRLVKQAEQHLRMTYMMPS